MRNTLKKRGVLAGADTSSTRALQRANQLMENSRYIRSLNNPECKIYYGENDFQIIIYKDGSDPKLTDVQNLFNKVFCAGEVEDEKMLRCAINGLTPWGTPDAKYKVIGILDKEGHLLSVCAGTTISISENKMIHCIEYAVTNPDARQGGLAREAYISSLLDAIETAKANWKELCLMIGECTPGSEVFWNNLGWKRIYVESFGTHTEVPYTQPALEFNPKTGYVSPNASEVIEHMMLDSFGGDITIKDLINAHEALVRHTAEWPIEAFNSKEAHLRHVKYIENLVQRFVRFVQKYD
ncbi:MAG: hypothetical protein ACKOW9_05605, partial [Candidatus Paceibacterota bacterium]